MVPYLACNGDLNFRYILVCPVVVLSYIDGPDHCHTDRLLIEALS